MDGWMNGMDGWMDGWDDDGDDDDDDETDNDDIDFQSSKWGFIVRSCAESSWPSHRGHRESRLRQACKLKLKRRWRFESPRWTRSRPPGYQR